MSRNIIKKYSISFYWLPFEAIFIVISLIIRELNKKHRYNVGIEFERRCGIHGSPKPPACCGIETAEFPVVGGTL